MSIQPCIVAALPRASNQPAVNAAAHSETSPVPETTTALEPSGPELVNSPPPPPVGRRGTRVRDFHLLAAPKRG